jgi:hypothetical protein
MAAVSDPPYPPGVQCFQYLFPDPPKTPQETVPEPLFPKSVCAVFPAVSSLFPDCSLFQTPVRKQLLGVPIGRPTVSGANFVSLFPCFRPLQPPAQPAKEERHV